jgi:hypothetical protein
MYPFINLNVHIPRYASMRRQRLHIIKTARAAIVVDLSALTLKSSG